MSKLREKAALIASNDTPFFKAAMSLELTGESSQGNSVILSPDKIKSHIYGSGPFSACKKWLHGTKRKPTTIKNLCNGFNAFRAKHSIVQDKSVDLQPTDFEEGFGRYEFSRKFGFAENRWEDAQQCIDAILYKINVFGREYSCDRNDWRDINHRLSGINYLYFKAYSSSFEETVFMRATLRVKNEYAVSETQKRAIIIVPCKLKVPVPVKGLQDDPAKSYIGKICIKGKRHLHMVFVDEETDGTDFIHVSVSAPSEQDRRFVGIFSSVSTFGFPYASVAILENMPNVINENDRKTPDATLQFMRSNAQSFHVRTEDIDENYVGKSDRILLELIIEKLEKSPFKG